MKLQLLSESDWIGNDPIYAIIKETLGIIKEKLNEHNPKYHVSRSGLLDRNAYALDITGKFDVWAIASDDHKYLDTWDYRIIGQILSSPDGWPKVELWLNPLPPWDRNPLQPVLVLNADDDLSEMFKLLDDNYKLHAADLERLRRDRSGKKRMV
jgi:hypothetical protein